jgi:hypothetical protein
MQRSRNREAPAARRDLEREPERFQHTQQLVHPNGLSAVLDCVKRARADASRQRELFLTQARLLPGVADLLSDLPGDSL